MENLLEMHVGENFLNESLAHKNQRTYQTRRCIRCARISQPPNIHKRLKKLKIKFVRKVHRIKLNRFNLYDPQLKRTFTYGNLAQQLFPGNCLTINHVSNSLWILSKSQGKSHFFEIILLPSKRQTAWNVK